jgi:hypothetical protein
MNNYRTSEQGGISGVLLAIILLSIAVAGLGALSVWAYLSYSEQKTNVDGKVELAVATAKKEQAEKDEAKFLEREKEPNRQFVGPDDYGRLTFSYPKTWSVLVARDVANGGSYQAYLNPITVPPVSERQQFALRVTIDEKDYDTILKSYQSRVNVGKLKTGAVSANGHDGTRIEGAFTEDIRGTAVIYKIRDKTVTIRTDADTFKPDFEKLITTIDFNS